MSKKVELPPDVLAQVQANVRSSLLTDVTLAGGNDKTNMTDIDTVKIIINEVLIDDNLESLTNLDNDEIETIVNAITLNEMFQNPLIQTKIVAFLKLKRSYTKDPRNLLEYLFRFANSRMPDSEGVVSNLAKYLRRD